MLANLFWGLILKDFIEVHEKKNKVVSCVFAFSAKRDLRPHFHVAVLQWWQRNVQKSVMHVQSCFFANLSLFLFCRSRCRYCRRRRCLSSLLFINVFALFPSDAFFDLERLESKCGPEGTNASNAF